jgi:response regulator RpfG family c-di-GMP phosphodiesterase
MKQFGVLGAAGRGRLRLPTPGERLTVTVTVVLAAGLLLLPFTDSHVSDTPVLSFMVAIALSATCFGIRGGIGSGLAGAGIASVWYLQGPHYAGGLVDYLSQAITFVAVGALVGSAVSERRELERALKGHNEVSVDALEQAVRDRTAELEEARLETLRRLALAAEYRDEDTSEHTERVGRTSALLAGQLGLSAGDVVTLRHAAPLHDIGKLGVSDSILLKPGRLTAREFEQMKRHTVAGSRILTGSSSDVLELAEQIALGHHERWDGSGYPAGLAGEAIPLCARIVAVADVFDALTHSRPYKNAWPVAAAAAEIHLHRGTQFDPTVVAAFERLDPNVLADHRLREAV